MSKVYLFKIMTQFSLGTNTRSFNEIHHTFLNTLMCYIYIHIYRAIIIRPNGINEKIYSEIYSIMPLATVIIYYIIIVNVVVNV